jgi:hypothetical protein
MAKAMSVTVAAADAMLTAFGALCNSGVVRLYSGTIPTNVQTALSGNTLLAEATMPNPAFVSFSTSGNNRTYTAGTITGEDAALATADASFFRVFASAGNGGAAIWQGTVGTTDADMIMAAVGIITGGPVNITSMAVTLPMA